MDCSLPPAHRSYSEGGSAPEGLAALRPSAALPETLIIGSLFSPRPFAPLSKSFRINTVTKLPQNPPLSNSFKINYFQTSRKAPLSKPFKMIALQKYGGWGSNDFRTFNFRLSTLGRSAKHLSFLSLTKKVQNASKTLQCFQSLTEQPSRTPKKSPNVFYHLQTASPVSTNVFYHLRKKGGWGVVIQLSNLDPRLPTAPIRAPA